MKSKYELINIIKFEADIKYYAKTHNLSLTKFFNSIYLSDSVFSNARQNFKRGTGKFNVSNYEERDGFGVIQTLHLNAICDKAGLNIDDYICKKKLIEDPKQDVLNEIDMDFKNIVVAGINDIRECNKTIISLIPDITKLISSNNDNITKLLASLVKVEYQNRDILASISSDIKAQGEKLDKIASGIQTINDKYNKPSAYIRK